MTYEQWLKVGQSHEADYTLGDRVPADRRTDELQARSIHDEELDAARARAAFLHEAERVEAALEASGLPGTTFIVDTTTETVTLAGGAIKAVGTPMVRFLADRLDSISLKRTTARLGHTSL